MRALVTGFGLVVAFGAAPARAADFTWPGVGTVQVTTPRGWSVDPIGGESVRFDLHAQPSAGPTVVVQMTLLMLPAEPVADSALMKALVIRGTEELRAAAVEKTLDPKPLACAGGSGWMFQITDASLVGKPRQPGNFKMMRHAMLALGHQVVAAVSVQFDDPAEGEVSDAMALVTSLRFQPGGGTATAKGAGGPFEFTVPQSRVVVRVPDPRLHEEPRMRKPGYFFLTTDEPPSLIISGWLEPESRYKGLKDFWAEETKSPAYADKAAPIRVEMLRVGPWEVVAYDIPIQPEGAIAPGTNANLRAERVLAGTWVDLHLSSTSPEPPATLRERLLSALRGVEVVEKK